MPVYPPPPPGISLTIPSQGTLLANGAEQTLADKTSTAPFKAQVDIDFTNMAAGDSVTIREYVMIHSGDALKLATVTTIADAQTEPIVTVFKKDGCYGYRVTLQQTAGVMRNYRWRLFVEE